MTYPQIHSDAVATNGSLSRNDGKALFLASLGGALEYYDFIVAVFFTKLLATVFFPANTPGWLGQLEVFCVFAAGYLVRPLGGVFFGHFGDRIGRKKMFALTLFLMATPTLFIGLLPSYASIGVVAPLLFLFCRILQGLSVGGEVPGAWIFCAEHVRRDRVGFACGSMMAGFCIGVLIGSLAAKLLFTYMDPASLQSWGWRLPFIMGGVFGLISVYLRRYLSETPIFQAIRARREANARLPIVDVLSRHRKAVVVSLLLTWVYSGIFVLYFVYVPTFIQSQFNISPSAAFAYNAWSVAFLIVGSVVAGTLADRFGVGRAYTVGCFAILVLSCLFFHALVIHSAYVWILYIVGGFCGGTLMLGPYMIIESFPPEVRFTGFALSYNTAYAIFGGTAPAIVTYLVAHGMPMMPAWYIGGLCVLAMLLGVVRQGSKRHVSYLQSVSPSQG